MGKIILFKDPANQIRFGGRVIGSHNLSPEIYKELIDAAPAHADLFKEVDEDEYAKELAERKKLAEQLAGTEAPAAETATRPRRSTEGK